MLNLKDREFFQDLSDDDGSKLSGGLGPYPRVASIDGATYYDEDGNLCTITVFDSGYWDVMCIHPKQLEAFED